MLRAYGSRCACCGENEIWFLALDHIGGRDKTINRGKQELSRLRRLGWPKDNYQLLCHNCNLAKGFYGVCPHIL
jgi:hypothetical protein